MLQGAFGCWTQYEDVYGGLGNDVNVYMAVMLLFSL